MIAAPSSNFTTQESLQTARPIFIVTIGTYEVPASDIVQYGQITYEKSLTLGDPLAANHEIILDNSSYKYSPDKSYYFNFTASWKYMQIKVEMGYLQDYAKGYTWQQQTVPSVDRLLLYVGYITQWNIKRENSPDSLVLGPSQAVITSQGLISSLFRKQVGLPDDLGNPSPLIYGSIRSAGIELNDNYPWSPDKSAGAEAGDLSELDDSYTYGTGTIVASTTQHYAGAYSYKCSGPAIDDDAQAEFYIGGPNETIGMISARFYFTKVPAGVLPPGFPQFLGFWNNSNQSQVYISCRDDGELQARYGPTLLGLVGANVHDLLNTRWITLTVGIDLSNPGAITVWNDSQRVVDYLGENLSGYTVETGRAGLWRIPDSGSVDDGWEVYVDDIKLYNAWYAKGCYLPGYPFTSMDEVYRDSLILPKEMPYYWKYRENRAWYSNPYVKKFAYGGQVISDLWTSRTDYGVIGFTDYSDLPSGNIIIGATKDATTHPVDAITALLVEGDIDSYIDSDSFDETKNTYLDDISGCTFSEVSIADAISEICHKFLYDFYEDFGLLYLQARGQNNPVVDTPIIGASQIISELTYNLDNLASMVIAKYGWYSNNPIAYPYEFIKETNSSVYSEIGKVPLELNFEYSESVSCDVESVVTDKVDKLLDWFSSPVKTIKAVLGRDYFRLQIGELVKIEQNDFFDYLGDPLLEGGVEIDPDPIYFEVYGKVYDLDRVTVEVTLNQLYSPVYWQT